MIKYSWEHFDDVFGTQCEKSLGTTLEEVHDSKQDRKQLEVTINYPRDVNYLRMDNEHRKKMYSILFEGLVKYLTVKYNMVKDSRFIFETSNIGLHLHGYIDLDFNGLKGTIYGLVEECSKYILLSIPPGRSRINTFERGVFYDTYPRFVCPALCIGYNTRSEFWRTYIDKAQ